MVLRSDLVSRSLLSQPNSSRKAKSINNARKKRSMRLPKSSLKSTKRSKSNLTLGNSDGKMLTMVMAFE